jgi:hypothetical protein
MSMRERHDVCQSEVSDHRQKVCVTSVYMRVSRIKELPLDGVRHKGAFVWKQGKDQIP